MKAVDCKYCNKKIGFIRNIQGKMLPVDYTLGVFCPSNDAGKMVVTEGGLVGRMGVKFRVLTEGHEPHWLKCTRNKNRMDKMG